ncbi:MAE_28990/MAE_18760 family HEPN-like nuclease [Acinetobacter bereziniae]|uniref:MAE_28990/MAE_18760 family HEPN-like nuclease n=1 Tax=Acinetobacter bereziniae TaxID=106648 RepID=UPI0032B4B7DB
MKYSDLENMLFEDLSWRKSELSSLFDIAFNTKKSLSKSNDQDDTLYKTVIKTLYLLLYSHWEGYIKKTCKIYLTYINHLNIKTCDLTNNFSALILKKSINNCYSKEIQESLSIDIYLNFVDLHSSKLNERFKVEVKIDNDFDDGFIKTFSNLNYKNYKNLINSIDLPFPEYFYDANNFINILDVNNKNQEVELLKELLDFKLLQYRHSIAHGGSFSLDLDLDLYENLQTKILYLMDMHCKNIQDYCYNSYFEKNKNIEKKQYLVSNNLAVKNYFDGLKASLLIPDEEFLADHI